MIPHPFAIMPFSLHSTLLTYNSPVTIYSYGSDAYYLGCDACLYYGREGRKEGKRAVVSGGGGGVDVLVSYIW